jgi:hypothetical protein
MKAVAHMTIFAVAATALAVAAAASWVGVASSSASSEVRLYGCSAVARQHPVEVVFYGTKVSAAAFCPHWHPPAAAWRKYASVHFVRALSKNVCTFSGTNGLLLDVYSKPSYARTVKRTICKPSLWARLGFYPFH